MLISTAIRLAGNLLLLAATAYIVLTVIAVWLRSGVGSKSEPDARVGISVLKPLCGSEPRLYENLRSFCAQDHADYQLVFGVREADDEALTATRRLQAEFPLREIAVIVDPRVHGLNLKVSNLLNLLPHARHDWLVLADSDIAVRPDYLRRVTAPLAQPEVGLVTCLYRGRTLGGLWSRLGAQFIDQWFRPSIALAQMFGAKRFGFGATLALRRETLIAIGGLAVVSDQIADDFWLSERIADLGLKTLLSDHEVTTDVIETRAADLVAHELRWFRTIRSVRPRSYLFSGICFTLPVVALAVGMAGLTPMTSLLAIIAVTARLGLFAEAQLRGARLRELPANFAVFLLRDTLSLWLWARALVRSDVRWRGQQINLDSAVEARAS